MSESDGNNPGARVAEEFSAGVVAHRENSFAVAEQCYREAIAIDPGHAEAHNNLGILVELSGCADEAEAHYRNALSGRPSCTDAHCNMGLLLHSGGYLAEAEVCYRRAILVNPEHAIAHNKLGLVLQSTGRRLDAECHFRYALKSVPHDADVLANLGAVLHQDGRCQEAETYYRKAIECAPLLARAHRNLGVLLHQLGRELEAEACFRRAISFDPSCLDAHGNLGNLLYGTQRYSDAEACYRTVLEQSPDSVEAINNLGRVLQDSGRLAEAEQCFRRVLMLAPERRPTAFNLTLVLLAMGCYEEGWPLYEARYDASCYWGEDASCHERPALPCREWRGEPLEGRSLVVVHEQGLGDSLHFCRYLPLLKALGVRRLSVICPTALRRVIESIEGVDSCYTTDELGSLSVHDFACVMMSLPLRFGTTLETIPGGVRYIRPAEGLTSEWTMRLPTHGLRVGLVWAGDSRPEQANANSIDRRRSFHASMYLPLLEVRARFSSACRREKPQGSRLPRFRQRGVQWIS
ncbi:tetratricopeptide repeat protein [Burkholderia pyrrocinia]|uniref:tetratricopeptide repeat protein n=1 Tax=Burkholderia pyrrocinia TaxID=60550 RepID=UPI001BD19A44|nr:tetratricopeptide repeat protein [Burkholderia pyrrocinia]QVN21307.1 tetratricopeptide repeat protein [Burkholderia pyrrocinia]